MVTKEAVYSIGIPLDAPKPKKSPSLHEAMSANTITSCTPSGIHTHVCHCVYAPPQVHIETKALGLA